MIEKYLKEQKNDFPSFNPDDYPVDVPDDKPLFLRMRKSYDVSDSRIRSIIDRNIVEVTFKRRIWPLKPKKIGHRKPYRRMLATSYWKYISKHPEFKFKPPQGIRPRTKSWYKKRKLIIVWDLIRLDFRMISLDDYEIAQIYPVKTKEQQEKFLTYWKNMLKRWGRRKLRAFFDK